MCGPVTPWRFQLEGVFVFGNLQEASVGQGRTGHVFAKAFQSLLVASNYSRSRMQAEPAAVICRSEADVVREAGRL